MGIKPLNESLVFLRVLEYYEGRFYGNILFTMC